jgi:hypothetical protein
LFWTIGSTSNDPDASFEGLEFPKEFEGIRIYSHCIIVLFFFFFSFLKECFFFFFFETGLLFIRWWIQLINTWLGVVRPPPRAWGWPKPPTTRSHPQALGGGPPKAQNLLLFICQLVVAKPPRDPPWGGRRHPNLSFFIFYFFILYFSFFF